MSNSLVYFFLDWTAFCRAVFLNC